MKTRLIGGGALVMVIATAACSSNDSATTATGSATSSAAASCVNPNVAADGSWSFTDDLGKTVTLDQAPTTFAGLSDVVYSMMNYGLNPVAAFGYSGITNDVRFDDMDTTGITEVGKIYGEINLEQLLGTEPDVILTNLYPTDSAGTIDPAEPLYGFSDVAQQAEVEKVAPIITILMGGTALDVIKRTTELAVALGACSDSGPVVDSKADFDAASAALGVAGATGTTVEAIYADADGIYAAKAPDDPSLRMYSDLGVSFVDPGGDGYYWEIFSWENADKLTGDVLLYSARGYLPEQLNEQPTFAALPVAASNQLYAWDFAGMDYPSQAVYMKELAGHLTSAKQVN